MLPNGLPAEFLRDRIARFEAAMKEKLAGQAAEIEALRAKRDHAAISSKGQEKGAKTRRGWAAHALPFVDAAKDETSDNSIILTLRAEFKNHPNWPKLPGDRAIQQWMSPIRRPKIICEAQR
jgi:hypothetical protein